MVKKKRTSKRVSLADKYRIERRVVEANRKKRKQGNRDAKNGVFKHKKKDPGIPNSWPFKAELLEEIAQAKVRAEAQKLKKKSMADLMREAQASKMDFESKTEVENAENLNEGQSSRRAYLCELKKVINDADVILEILDARDPAGTRISKSLEDTILSCPEKKLVLVLNKVDLIPKEALQGWLTYLRQSLPCIAVKAGISASKSIGNSNAEGSLTTSSAVGMEGLLQLLKNYSRSGDTKTAITVGMIGYPNVGKSSLINSLKRTRAVGVSSRPGFTKVMQEVVLDKNVRLLDSPGIVFADNASILKNCLSTDSLVNPLEVVESLIDRCSVECLMLTYSLPRFRGGDMFLAMIAKKFGKVKKGGTPDKVSAAKTILQDWNTGKIPFFTPPPELKDKAKSNVQIVSTFQKEFKACDEEIIKTLRNEDDLEFVALSARDAIEDDEMEDDKMEDMDTESPSQDAVVKNTTRTISMKNSRLANAEDFHFER